MEQKIVKFIARHHVMTLATVGEDGVPYCSNAFYSFDAERGVLVFSSSLDTLHAQHFVERSKVAASIVLESRVVGKLQGVQIVGKIFEAEAADQKSYISSFPYAALAPLKLWRLEMNFVKLTDNRLGFGKKLIWSRE